MTLKVSEVYTSVQGEGPYTGTPTTFVRFGGCNMRCPGWPCDTLYAVEPKYHKEWKAYEPSELYEATPAWPKHVCLTGGEPFMQKNSELEEYCKALREAGYGIEAFSNGSFVYQSWVKNLQIRIMMDWKLKGSGEAETALEIRERNYQLLHMLDGVKFVVKGVEDLNEAHTIWARLNRDRAPQFWVGAAWGTVTDDFIVEYIKIHELPWNLNVQIHKYIWDAKKRGV